MISERKLANAFSSFWRELLPMSDSYLRRLNLECERFETPIKSDLHNNGKRRSIVNEMAFTQFTHCIDEDGLLSPKKFGATELRVISDQVRRYISRIENPLSKTLLDVVNKDEMLESVKIRKRLLVFFNHHSIGPFIPSPVFHGCGTLQTCRGDVLSQKTLFEIKAGDRHFRIPDLRQVLVYCSLNFASHQYEFEYICLVNPRTGLFFTERVDRLLIEMSGRSSFSFFTEFIDFVCAERVSI